MPEYDRLTIDDDWPRIPRWLKLVAAATAAVYVLFWIVALGAAVFGLLWWATS